ncbi:MAG TPA: class I SAM-dependent methyltransferase [Lysobacter sp.]|jgi:SAM-dependent methyltransferase|nr:class I SAM-dependent methyltransferase [Lysobacter sp.]
MSRDRNPQAEQMGDESMARNLAHQAEAIWPQEHALLDRYGLSGSIRILDLGCGTGEITRRLADRYPQATLVGIDILETNLTLARRDSAAFGERIGYEQGDAFALHHGDASFDLVVCRHMSQAVPDFPLVLAEITRVLKPGGWLHLLSEDYGMLHMPVIERADGLFDPDRFWNANAIAYLHSIGCDGRIGRHSPSLLDRAGYRRIALDYVTVDTLRVERSTFAGIMRAWRDGYSEVLAEASGRPVEEVMVDFNTIIDSIETPPYYAVWHVPVVSGQTP